MKKSIVLIPLPSLIKYIYKKSFVRSDVLSLSSSFFIALFLNVKRGGVLRALFLLQG